MTGILIRKGKDTHQEEPSEGRGRHWRDAATSQGTHRGTRSWKRQEAFSLRTLRGSVACQHLDVGLLPARAMREYISVVLSFPICYSNPGNNTKPRAGACHHCTVSVLQGFSPWSAFPGDLLNSEQTLTAGPLSGAMSHLNFVFKGLAGSMCTGAIEHCHPG